MTTRHRGVSRSNSTTSSPPFPKWPSPIVISNGDYREELFLEDHIGGPLYSNQGSIPKLPVPATLQETVDRFLPTALPLAESAQEEEDLIKACRDFPKEAAHLQIRLLKRQQQHNERDHSSWLQHWWNTLGYLQVRDSNVINVSYYFHFADDPTIYAQHDDANPSCPMIKRGAAILYRTAQFRKMVCSGQLPPETIGKRNKKPLCMTALKYMFHACRIPQRHQDAYEMHDPLLHTHCIVAHKGQFFSVPLVSSTTTQDPLSLQQLQQQLERVVQMASNNNHNHHHSVPLVGYLTSQERDMWADARNEILNMYNDSKGLEWKRALDILQSGAMLLCLDDEEPVSRDQCATQFLHGGHGSGYNRWFDKSIQIICTKNGKAGLLGEHSMMDGMPVIGLADYILAAPYASIAAESAAQAPPTDDSSSPPRVIENLFAHLTPSRPLQDMIDRAKVSFEAQMDRHEINVQCFFGYGSTGIKKMGFSPDAYVQMAMQLATHRLWGRQAGSYESTQTRSFLHGRTEVSRAVSPQSRDLVEQFWNPNLAPGKKCRLLEQAVTAHVAYTKMAAVGLGVDRHFLGLSLSAQDEEQQPALFSDPVFQRSKRWRVSTSNLTHERFENWGYGQVVPDGVGLSYSVRPDRCTFSVTALKKYGWTERLAHHLEEALVEMQRVVQLAQAERPPSKL